MRRVARALVLPSVLANVTAAATAAVLALSTPAAVSAQGGGWVREHYTKAEYDVPMRDGVKLHTVVYSPRDTTRTWPILLRRTPYGAKPYGPDSFPEAIGPSDRLMRDGFIIVYQDVRGRFLSEGEFRHVRPQLAARRGPQDVDESTDAWDTIDWLVKHVPRNSGKVGMYGISYPGFYASTGAIDAHPALVASSPQAPVADWFIGDDLRHNGAFFLSHAFNFLANNFRRWPHGPTGAPPFQHGTPDGYDFFLDIGGVGQANARWLHDSVPFFTEALAHDTYDDFWKARNLLPHLKGMRPAMLVVGGWFDAEDLYGALETYRAIERQSPGATNSLVMGPWYHGQWAGNPGLNLGDVRFGSATSVFYRDSIEAPFFLRHLKGAPAPALPEAYVFETGSNRWRKYSSWPPANAVERALHLRPGGGLSIEAPAGASRSGPRAARGTRYDEYVSDPARPVPVVPYVTNRMTREYMVDDQRFAAQRPDVLVYQTEPLAEDVTLAGPVGVTLRVSTSGSDADFIVKLVDVYPDDFAYADSVPTTPPAAGHPVTPMGGYQQLVRGEPFRGKFRRGFERPVPFTPGRPDSLAFTMPDVNHTFRRGHRIMVQVQSTWFPLVDRNPGKFMPIAEAKASDYVPTTQRVYEGSAVRVWVVE